MFGGGSSGVLLAHAQAETLCDWLPWAGQLADDGYQVLLYEMRSLLLRDNRNAYDRRGASSIIAGGAGTGATAIASVAGQVQGLKGMFLLTRRRERQAGDGAGRCPVRAAHREHRAPGPGAGLRPRVAASADLPRPLAGGVLLLAMVAAVVVVLRRRRSRAGTPGLD